jgi:hypothetical protein
MAEKPNETTKPEKDGQQHPPPKRRPVIDALKRAVVRRTSTSR